MFGQSIQATNVMIFWGAYHMADIFIGSDIQ